MQRSLSLSSMAALGVASGRTGSSSSSRHTLTSLSQAPPTFTSSALPVTVATTQATNQIPAVATAGTKTEFTGAPPPTIPSGPGPQGDGWTGR